MKGFTMFSGILNFVLGFLKPKYMTVWVKKGETWKETQCPNPIKFSELNEIFGEGQWKL
jgi:hypothetical protein